MDKLTGTSTLEHKLTTFGDTMYQNLSKYFRG